MELDAEEEITKQFYNQNAKAWATGHPDINFWQMERQKFCSYLPKGKIIDLGCGTGREASWFIKNGYDYLGIDASTEMLAEAKKINPQAHFLNKSFYELDFKENEFDGFWASCSFLHVPKTKISAVLKNVTRVIKSEGFGFISVKEGSGENMEQYKNTSEKRFFSYYSQPEFSEILEKNNFQILYQGKHLNKNDQKFLYLAYVVKILK